MAFPVIVINNAAGSDTAASGAGPGDGTTAGTAVTGAAAATDGTNGKTVTITDAVDLSAVPLNTSALFLNDATAGHRNFDQITAISGSSGAWTVTVANGFTVSLTGKSWAIGGKRASGSSASSCRLMDNNAAAGDAMPGWVIQWDDGHTETVGATAGPSGDGIAYRLRRAGDTTNGPIILRGKPGAAVRPVVTFANNGIGVYLNGNYQQVSGVELQNSNATRTSSTAVNVAGSFCRITDVKVADAAHNFGKGVTFAGSNTAVRDCEVANTLSHGFDNPGGGLYLRLRDLWVHNCAGNGVNIGVDPGALSFRESLVTGNAAGLVLAGLGTANSRRVEIEGNTFDANTGAGVDVQSTGDGLANGTFVNNIFSNNAYGLKFSGAGATDVMFAAEGVLVDRNDTFGNATAAYFSASGSYTNANCPWATNDPGLDPTYTNAAGGNYAVGTNLKAVGYPAASRTLGANQSATHAYVDIGAAQRQEAGGGGTYTAAANVRSGTDRGDGTLGTLAVPSPTDVLTGVSTDATTGSLTLPTAAQVLVTVAYGVGGTGSTGTVTLPTVGNVRNTVTYGAALGLTGTYDPVTGNYTDPGVANVLSPTTYKFAGSTLTGTATTSGGMTLSQLQTELNTRGLTSAWSAAVPANVTQVNGSATSTSDGTAQGGTSTTVTLAAADSAGANAYVDRALTVVAGTGAGQSRVVTAYNSATKVATVHRAWDTTPDATSQYAIDPTAAANAVEWGGAAVGAMPNGGPVTLAASQPNYAPLTTLGAAAPAGWVNTAAFAAGATVPRVTLADTVTAYTGNTPQTGDAFARIGANGAGLTAVALAASQPTYAPAKAGDAMTLTAAYDAAKGAAQATTALSTAAWTAGRAANLDNLSAGPVALATQVPANFTTATFSSAGVFSIGALQNAPTGSGGTGGASILQIQTELDTRGLTAALTTTVTTNLDAKVSTRLASAGYTAPPTAAAVATAVLTDTSSSDEAAAGSLGHLVTTAPAWYAAPDNADAAAAVTLLTGLVVTGDHTQLTAHALALAAGGGGGGTVTGYAAGQDPATLLAAAGYTGARAAYLDTINPARAVTVRNQDAVTAPTLDDCLVGAWSEAFGKEPTLTSTSWVKQKPDNSAALRTFTLTTDGSGNVTARA